MLVVAPPGEAAEVFLVMQFDPLAGAAEEGVGDGRVIHAEFEDIGLDGAGILGVGALVAVSGLDQAAFVGLEDLTFVGELIQFAGLIAVTENIEETDVAECGSTKNEDQERPPEDFFSYRHNVYFTKKFYCFVSPILRPVPGLRPSHSLTAAGPSLYFRGWK